jgi:hypothetical protein
MLWLVYHTIHQCCLPEETQKKSEIARYAARVIMIAFPQQRLAHRYRTQFALGAAALQKQIGVTGVPQVGPESASSYHLACCNLFMDAALTLEWVLKCPAPDDAEEEVADLSEIQKLPRYQVLHDHIMSVKTKPITWCGKWTKEAIKVGVCYSEIEALLEMELAQTLALFQSLPFEYPPEKNGARGPSGAQSQAIIDARRRGLVDRQAIATAAGSMIGKTVDVNYVSKVLHRHGDHSEPQPKNGRPRTKPKS